MILKKEKKMKKIALFSVILVLVAGVAFAKSYEVTKKVGEYTVIASIDKNPPIAGENALTVSVKDASGKAVTDAKVKVDYSMPAMPGMPAMNYKADAVMKDGLYSAKLNLSMSGGWNIAVKVARGGKISTMKFNVDAQ